MKLQTIPKTAILALTLIELLSGCNSSASFSGNANKATQSISVVSCEGHTLEEYTLLQSKDTLQRTSDTASYEFVHDQDGEKRICAVSGTIEILRSES